MSEDGLVNRVTDLEKGHLQLSKDQATLDERTKTMQRDISGIRTDVKGIDTKIDMNSQKSIEGHMKVMGEVNALSKILDLTNKTIKDINEPLKSMREQVRSEELDTAHRQGSKDTVKYLIALVLAVLTLAVSLVGAQSCQIKQEMQKQNGKTHKAESP